MPSIVPQALDCECTRLSLFAGARTFGSWVFLSLPKSTWPMLFDLIQQGWVALAHVV